MTEAVLFSTGFSWLMYLGFAELFKSDKICFLVKSDQNWRYLQANNICTIRVVMAIVAYFMFFILQWHALGIFLFTQAAVLDGVDGLVARATDMITEFGAWYDPLCDKITYIPPIISFILDGVINTSFGWIALFLLSEFFGQFIVRKIQVSRNISVAANLFGKIKAVLCFALIIYSAILMDDLGIHNFAGELFRICAVLSFVSAVSKLMPKNIYVKFVIITNLFIGTVGVYLLVGPKSDIFLHLAIMTMIADLILSNYLFFSFGNLRVMIPRKIPKTVLTLMAAFIFCLLAYSIKINDDSVIGVSMIVLSIFFLILGRLRMA